MFRKCPYGVGFPEEDGLIAHGMLDGGLAHETYGVIEYNIRNANEYMTREFRKRIRDRCDKKFLANNADDFRVLYTPRFAIDRNSEFISDSGITCQYCTGGRRVDYNRSFDLVQSITDPTRSRIK